MRRFKDERGQADLDRRTSITDAQSENPDRGLFDDESIMRRVGREGLVLLGGGRAVLLQIAHPLIAAGVGDHSSFQADPLARFLRTMHFLDALVFGRTGQVRKAMLGFERVHDRIHGRLATAAGRYRAGTRYDGHDPELKLWVFATLVDTSAMAFERFVRPMSATERSNYYADCRILGKCMGIPPELLPDSVEGFRQYMANMLDGDQLAVTPIARRLGEQVLHPPVGIVPTLSAALMRLATAGMLPERFRRDFALPWTAAHQLALSSLTAMLHTLRPIAPAAIWRAPLQGGSLAAFLLRELNR
jgi:uncharacterized protein (DUF2236 family)